MSRRSTVRCEVCNTTLILPDDPTALANVVTDFTDAHHRMQHWKIELIPGSDGDHRRHRGAASQRPQARLR